MHSSPVNVWTDALVSLTRQQALNPTQLQLLDQSTFLKCLDRMQHNREIDYLSSPQKFAALSANRAQAAD